MSLPKKGMLRWVRAIAGAPPAVASGCLRRRIATLEGIDRETLDALAVETERAEVIQGLRQEPRPGAQPRRHARPRSGRVRSAPRWIARHACAAVPDGGRLPPQRGCQDLPELINQKFPDLDIQHVHHAGNSSGVVDGSAAILWASEDYTKAHGHAGTASWRWPTWVTTRPHAQRSRREGAGEPG